MNREYFEKIKRTKPSKQYDRDDLIRLKKMNKPKRNNKRGD